MLTFTDAQLHRLVLENRQLLLQDVVEHIQEHLPSVARAYPWNYFVAVVNDGIEIALEHKMDDVFSVRLFVRLRWEIAPGWFKEPRLAAVLARRDCSAAERFDIVARSAYGDAWQAATGFAGPEEWRRGAARPS